MPETKLVAFFGTVAASAVLTLVSKRISTPYGVRRLVCTFAPGCANLVALRFLQAEDNHAPTSGAPNGTSLLADYGQVDYLVGDDEQKSLQHEMMVPEAGSFLKVYAVNADTFAHSINAQIEIEIPA